MVSWVSEPVPTRFVSSRVRAVRRRNRWRKTIAAAAAVVDAADVTAALVAAAEVAKTVPAEIAAGVRLAVASRLRPADAKAAVAYPRRADPVTIVDRVKRVLRARIVGPGAIVLRGRIVDRARTAGRVKRARPAIAPRARRVRRSVIGLRAKNARRPKIADGGIRVRRWTTGHPVRMLRCSAIAARVPTVAATAIAVAATRASTKPRHHSPLAIRARPSRVLQSRVESRRASMTAKAVAAGAGEVAAAVAVIVTSAGRRCRARRCLRFPQ